MAANRTGASAFAANVSAEQEDVHDFPHGIHGVLLLGDAEAPGNDGRSRPAIDLAQFADFRFRYAGLQFDLRPRGGGDQFAIRFESARESIKEVLVDGLRIGLRRLEQMFGHAAHECEIAGDPRLDVHCSDAGRTEQRHFSISCGTIVRVEAASMSGLT